MLADTLEEALKGGACTCREESMCCIMEVLHIKMHNYNPVLLLYIKYRLILINIIRSHFW